MQRSSRTEILKRKMDGKEEKTGKKKKAEGTQENNGYLFFYFSFVLFEISLSYETCPCK